MAFNVKLEAAAVQHLRDREDVDFANALITGERSAVLPINQIGP